MNAAARAAAARSRYHEALAVVAAGDAAWWRDVALGSGPHQAFARFDKHDVSTHRPGRRPPLTVSPYANDSPAGDLEGLVARGLAPPDATDPGAGRRWFWERGSGGPEGLPPGGGWGAAMARRVLSAWAAFGPDNVRRAESLARVIEPGCVVEWRAWSLSRRVSLVRRLGDLLPRPDEVPPERRRWAEARRHQAAIATLAASPRPGREGPTPPHVAAAGELFEDLDVLLVSRTRWTDGTVSVALVVDDHP